MGDALDGWSPIVGFPIDGFPPDDLAFPPECGLPCPNVCEGRCPSVVCDCPGLTATLPGTILICRDERFDTNIDCRCR